MSDELEQLRVAGVPMVLVPLSLYHAMAECYYGGGMNHWERTNKPQPMPKVAPSVPTAVEDEMVVDDAKIRELRTKARAEAMRTLPAGTIPQGAAAREWAQLAGVNNASKRHNASEGPSEPDAGDKPPL